MFVGRTESLALLAGARERARAGVPARVLVEGPAGIGKTALVRHFLRGSGQVSRAAGEEAESELAFGVLAQLLGRRARWPDASTAGGELLEAWDETQQTDPEPGGAAGEPVVVVVDDAQWADRASLQALTFALRRLRADRVLVLLVVRDIDDARLPGGLRRCFTADDVARVRLDGLAPTELRRLGSELGAAGLTAGAADRLHAHTGGNPLHVRTLLEQEGPGLLEALARTDVAPPAPRSFTALVLARLAAISAPTEALVCAAAVLGAHCGLAEAWTVADENPQVADENPLGVVGGVALAVLEEAVRAGLLTEAAGDPVIRFPHPLMHAAVYHWLGPARRAALHLRAAAVVTDEAQRLRHRALAAVGPDPGLAGELASSGRRLAAEGAWAGAAGQLDAAARLTADTEAQERCSLEAVECRLLAGDVPDVGEVAERIRRFAPGGWRSYLLGRLSLFDVARAEALLTDAWHRCDPEAEPVLGARIAGQFAALHGSMSHGAEMAEWADLALRLAPDDTATDMIRYLRLIGLAMNGRAADTLAALGPLPDPVLASPAQLEQLLGRGNLRPFVGDLTGAVRDLSGVFGACRGRAASFRVVAATALASAEYRVGRWTDALVHTEFALSLAADTDQPHIALHSRTLAAQLCAAGGAFAKAQAHACVVRDYARGSHVSPALAAALAEGYLARAQGDPEGVVVALDPLLALGPRGSLEEPGTVPWADLLSDAWSALGEEKRAARILAPYEVLAARRGHHEALLVAARARGTLESARGDTEAAERAFRLGLRHRAHVEAPFDRALLHLAYGGFLRRTGKRTSAAEQLQSARGLLAHLDAKPDLERCDRELAACGLRPAREHERTSDLALLTPQEIAVARLVASGQTNRQVARELVISVKTVEYHLGRIFPKLGVDSRTRLAARLAGGPEPRS
ncbi:AAA family ATPase [Streptomyces sp. NPDC101776]|uniref:AAA family ATPase n=1 Tax=Streptomyces sp. NPDC101776 TaxID=3366146 RepID=UPI003817A374